ncbi:MAG: biopolymer transporter ExbD [Gemmatimonadaceae bacterium]
MNADINVVSLIDVMLLLLVIFMITAPMMQGGIDLNLPKADAKPMEAKDAVSIDVMRDGRIVIDGNTMSIGEFRAFAKTLTGNRSKNGVYVRGDKDANYGLIAQVMAILVGAGVTSVGLATEPEEIR